MGDFVNKYIGKKLLRLIIVLFGVSLLTFVFTSWIEGNPAEIVAQQSGIDPTKEDIAVIEEELGLNKTLPERYFIWLKDAVRLDFGNSYITDKPVIEEILYRVPVTATLTISSFLLMFIISITLGISLVVVKSNVYKNIIESITYFGMGIPGFVLGLVMAYIFSVKLQVLPMVGNKTFLHCIMPVVTLSLPMACRYTRIIKTNLLEVIDEDYIFLLRTKGMSERVILLSNALKNAFIPVVNLMGLTLGNLMGGSVVIENIFSWPGLGSYIMSSINNRDYPVILAYIFIMAIVFVIINFVVDMIMCFLDPRIVIQGRGRND